MTDAVIDVEIGAVDRGEALRYLGYRGQHVDADLEARLDEALARVEELSRPRAALRVFAVGVRKRRRDGTPELHLDGSALVLSGRSIAEHLARADEACVMAATLGMGVERELHRLSLRGDTLAQMLFDAAATAAIEDVADGVESRYVAQAARQGKRVTTRFSPGYGDLPLDCQQTLLASVDAARRLGLSLTASNLLVPTKSVTAVMGAGERVVRARQDGCASCTLRKRCSVRATGRTCHE